MPLKNHIKEHLDETFKLNQSPTPQFKMWLAGLSMTIPLLIGYFRNESYLSMFGALMCLVYYLNDHFGSLKKRIVHLWVVFIILMVSFILGSFLATQLFLVALCIFVFSFLVGKSKNHGIELERLLLFMALQFLTATADPNIKNSLVPLVSYSFISFIIYQCLIIFLRFFTRHDELEIKSKRQIFKHISSLKESNYFALVCALFTTTSYLISISLQFTHANWIVGTALIVILPDSKLGIYKSLQRIFGTVLGVFISAVAVHFIHEPLLIMVLVFIAAFLMPLGLSKNYWLGNISIAALIIFFLELAFPNSIENKHLAYWRIVDIGIGGTVGILAAVFLNPKLNPKLIFKKMN